MSINISTISNPEFINLQPLEISPMISECEIKIAYIGKNRNGTFISKEVATEMSKTLRGSPIVGYFSEEKNDFRDHGDRITIDGDGFHFDCLTKPYGFVAPDARVWFQMFEETDEFGNTVQREYLVTNGYLWVGQYPELKDVVENGRPHSMELDANTIDGKWKEDPSSGLEFFIITDATFSKLCILGKDVEPCFEGSEIKSVNNSFSFENSLNKMMEELKFALKNGGNMDDKNVQTTSTVEPVTKEKNEFEEKYSLLKEDYDKLQTDFNNLSENYKELLEFKVKTEDKEKDVLISSFSMLSDEDKKDVIENKSKYTLDEIESKLSVICVRKRVNFNLKEEQENKDSQQQQKKEEPSVTFSLENNGDNLIPAWITACQNRKNKNKV